MRQGLPALRMIRLCLALTGAIASGEVNADDAALQKGLWNITVENDIFAGHNDGHYTGGTSVSHVPVQSPGWLTNFMGRFPCLPCRNTSAVEYTIGQSIFTPEDISVPELQANDRPYAGWLYAAIGLLGSRETNDPNLRSYDTVQLTVGVVGPASMAGKTQKFFHRITGSTRPAGWSNQLDNEPGAVVTYTRHWQYFFSGKSLHGLGQNLSGHVAGALGNVYTYAGSGAMWRMGKNLRDDAGPETFRNGFPGATYFSPRAGLSWYVFLGVEARVMARNIFLDGNTFADSHSVDKKTIVFDTQVGLAVSWKKIRLTFSEVRRSREFTDQNGADKYGAISLTFSL